VEVTKSTVSATQKGNRVHDKESSIMEKWPKMAAIETGGQEERRIWENESEEEDFYTSLEKAQPGLYIFVG
jgi:hypothetical protein